MVEIETSRASGTSETPKLRVNREVLDRLRKQDPGLLESIARDHAGHLYRAARGAGLNEQEASDVVQATLVTFLERLEDFEGRSKIRTWLFGILYKKISEMRRALAKRNREDDIEQVFESRFASNGHWSRPPVDPETFLAATQTLEAIGGCMEELTENQQQAFYLKEVEGFSTAEICNILSVTATNLGVILHRARNRLRECIEGKGIVREKKGA